MDFIVSSLGNGRHHFFLCFRHQNALGWSWPDLYPLECKRIRVSRNFTLYIKVEQKTSEITALRHQNITKGKSPACEPYCRIVFSKGCFTATPKWNSSQKFSGVLLETALSGVCLISWFLLFLLTLVIWQAVFLSELPITHSGPTYTSESTQNKIVLVPVPASGILRQSPSKIRRLQITIMACNPYIVK